MMMCISLFFANLNQTLYEYIMLSLSLIFALISAQNMNIFGNRRSCEMIMIIILLMIIAEDLKIFGDLMMKNSSYVYIFVEVSYVHKSGD
jgi:hypothetical protein